MRWYFSINAKIEKCTVLLFRKKLEKFKYTNLLAIQLQLFV